jgi:hypothetical protein
MNACLEFRNDQRICLDDDQSLLNVNVNVRAQKRYCACAVPRWIYRSYLGSDPFCAVAPRFGETNHHAALDFCLHHAHAVICTEMALVCPDALAFAAVICCATWSGLSSSSPKLSELVVCRCRSYHRKRSTDVAWVAGIAFGHQLVRPAVRLIVCGNLGQEEAVEAQSAIVYTVEDSKIGNSTCRCRLRSCYASETSRTRNSSIGSGNVGGLHFLARLLARPAGCKCLGRRDPPGIVVVI